MKKIYGLFLLVVICFLFPAMGIAAAEVGNTGGDVMYDQRSAIQNKSFLQKITFDRKQSYRIEGTNVVALPGKGKHWMELNEALPTDADIFMTLEPKRTKASGNMEVRMEIGICSFTLRDHRQGGTKVKIEKRGDSIDFNGMQTEKCGGDKLRVVTMPGSRVFEIQDLSVIRK